ncbi:MAG: type II toxin-antitoxin system VapC family toxin [Deltaproteobacteria bacterium]|nr:type II toxin-antitoxin system VapC family toxin [Deltaproteobacteria bacterium]
MSESRHPVDLILDASAVLAVLQQEAGAEVVEACMARAGICAVNLSEVAGKLIDIGMPEPEAQDVVEALGLTVIPFDSVLAWQAALLRPTVRRFGLSLGDRACLATGIALNRPVVGADKVWSELGLALEIKLIR